MIVKGCWIPNVFCICSSLESGSFLFFGRSLFSKDLSSFLSWPSLSSVSKSPPLKSPLLSSSWSSALSLLFCLILGSSVVLPSSSSSSSPSTTDVSNSSSPEDLLSEMEAPSPSCSLTGLPGVKSNRDSETIISRISFMFTFFCLEVKNFVLRILFLCCVTISNFLEHVMLCHCNICSNGVKCHLQSSINYSILDLFVV